MGSKYSSQATSGYNSSPPPDDGTQVAANLVSWSMVKTKLADVLKTFGEAINTALVSALDLSARAIASNDTAIASDHWKTLQVTGATTITLSSAVSMGAGYEVGVFNAGASTVTIAPGVGSDTINNVSASVTIPIKGTMIFRTNQALTGYNVVAQSNRMDAGAITGGTIDNAVIGGVTPLAGTFTTLTTTGALVSGTTGKVATTLGVGAATPATTGAGITFPAAQSNSSDLNTLDDYEEGNWTPSLGGSTTYTTQLGTYTKVGRAVHITGTLVINAIGTGSATTISGLPFTVGASGAVVISNVANSATNVVSLTGFVAAAGTTITMQGRTAAQASEALTNVFQNATRVDFSGTYL